MFVYLFIFLFVLLTFFATKGQPRLTRQMFAMDMLVLSIFIGISDMLGGFDRYIYGEVFDSIARALRGSNGIRDVNVNAFFWITEPAYLLWNVIIALFTQNRYIFIFITTLTIYFLFYRSFIENVSEPIFGLVIFLGLYFFFTFTYLRQVFAVAIIWNAVKYIEQRNLRKFILFTIIATLFHNSAIVCMAMYFVPVKKFNRKLILACFTICLLLGAFGIHERLFSAFESIVVNENRQQIEYGNIKRIRIEYILEASFFLYLLFRTYSNKLISKHEIVSLNIGILFCMVLALFCRSSDGGRVSWFFIIGLISTFSRSFASSGKLTLPGLGLIAVSAALYLRILTSWGGLLMPYKSFFTNGVRSNDEIHRFFEYDRQYDKDKFYK